MDNVTLWNGITTSCVLMFSCSHSLCRQSPWAVHIASVTTALGSGARGETSAPSAESPSSPRPAAWPSTTASTAWWRTWARTWRPGGGTSSARGKVRGASAISSHLVALARTLSSSLLWPCEMLLWKTWSQGTTGAAKTSRHYRFTSKTKHLSTQEATVSSYTTNNTKYDEHKYLRETYSWPLLLPAADSTEACVMDGKNGGKFAVTVTWRQQPFNWQFLVSLNTDRSVHLDSPVCPVSLFFLLPSLE